MSRHTGNASYSLTTKTADLWPQLKLMALEQGALVEKMNWQSIKQMFAIVI